MKKVNSEIILLILILLFAFFIRIYSLGNTPFWIDESISSIASRNIIEKGIPQFDSGVLYDRAYVFHYLQSFFFIFGVNDFTARLVSVIFGLLTVLLAYLIGKEYFKSGGLISALFMAVFYLEVFYSRQARFYQLFQLMFFLSLYLLYKSKENPKLIYSALISFIITVDIQTAGLVLVPFFIIDILMYNKKYLSLIPLGVFIYKFIGLFKVSSSSTTSAVNYISKYSSYLTNIKYLFILFVPGAIWSFKKNKRLTFLLIVPSLMLLCGIFFVKYFALRYAYFFVFPLVLYSSLLISFLYEKYGKLILISALILLIFPSNLIFPYTYVNVIIPVDKNYYDVSAPEINYKDIPEDIVVELKDNTLITMFSSGVEWYIKKPDYVFPFSMTGAGNDTISYNNVDIYTGAPILTERPEGSFYFIIDYFSYTKLKPFQIEKLNDIIFGCTIVYENDDLKIHKC